MRIHPIRLLRLVGILDGLSLVTLLFIAMPLKYNWDMPQVVTVNGKIHGGIVIVYFLLIGFVQLRVRWSIMWSALAVAVAFIPFGNFIYDRKLKTLERTLHSKPFERHWLLYAIIFFAFFDLFVQLPVMSTYALSVGATAFVAGIVVGLYSLTNTFGNILSGILTDKIGAYVVLVAGLVLSAVSLVCYQLVDGSATLLIVRCLHGFTSGLITPAAFALLANMRKEHKQGSGGAVTGSFVGIAAIVGPATGGILATKVAVPMLFTFVAIGGFTLASCLFLFVKKTKKTSEPKEQRGAFTWSAGLWQANIGAFFLMFSQGSIAYLLPMYVEGLGYNSRMSGTLMSMFGIVAVLIFILPTNRMFDILPARLTLAIGMLIFAISQFLIGQMETTISLYAALMLYGVGFAFIFPSINKLVVESTPPACRGQAYGYFYAFFSIGVVAGSFVLAALHLTNTPGFVFTSFVLLAFSIVMFTILARQKWRG